MPRDVPRLAPRILYQDDYLIVLNKPAGMAVHGGSGISRGVIEQLRLEFPQHRFMELAHRLDRETSGMLGVAIKRRALTALHEIFRQHRIHKRYLVLATGRWRDELPQRQAVAAQVRDRRRRTPCQRGRRRAERPHGFRRVKTWPGFALLEAELKTGRTHPGKRSTVLSLLSGGERALAAISLLLALFAVRPSPFCVLDEVDAPLDDVNVDRFVTVIREMSQHSQFIAITHNKRTMEAADILYGITMEEEGVSKVISVRMKAAA